MSASTPSTAQYTKSLPSPDAVVLYNLLRIYAGGDLGDNLMLAVRSVDALGTAIKDGYTGLTDEQRTSKQYHAWRKQFQKYIESQASRHVGRDRLAISLACFRDYIMKTDADTRWENLQECRRQLVDLYNTVAPLPFKL